MNKIMFKPLSPRLTGRVVIVCIMVTLFSLCMIGRAHPVSWTQLYSYKVHIETKVYKQLGVKWAVR